MSAFRGFHLTLCNYIFYFLVVAVAIDVGLMVGIALSLLSLVIRGQQPYICLLGNVPGTEIYLDIRKYKKAMILIVFSSLISLIKFSFILGTRDRGNEDLPFFRLLKLRF